MINNFLYKNIFCDNWFCNHFLKSKFKNSQPPSDVILLGRTPSEIIVLLLFIFDVYPHLSIFFILFLFFFIHFQATLPRHRHYTLASQAREGFHQLWALPQLLLIAFSFSSTTSATVLSGHFIPTGVFYLMLLPKIFGTSCFYQGFPGRGAGSFSLKFVGPHTDP